VGNVVQANLLAATTRNREALGETFNVALGGSTTLDELHGLIAGALAPMGSTRVDPLRPAPAGDIQHSSADISAIRRALEFEPDVSVAQACGDGALVCGGFIQITAHRFASVTILHREKNPILKKLPTVP